MVQTNICARLYLSVQKSRRVNQFSAGAVILFIEHGNQFAGTVGSAEVRCATPAGSAAAGTAATAAAFHRINQVGRM